MACTDFNDPFDFWTAFNGTAPFDAIYCPLLDSLGDGALIALFVFGPLMAMYYIHNDSPVVPIVLGVMLGSVIVAELPATVVNLFTVILVLVAPAAVLFMIHRARSR